MRGSEAVPRPARTALPFREVVELACRAPSVHNTQPWVWRAGGSRLRLYADRSRQLPHADPDGRSLVISCGAALHHGQVAARGLGWEVAVERCPDPGDPDLLATLDLTPGRVVPAAEEQLEALQARATDRRRFTSWPLPAERLDRLAEQAREWGALVISLVDPAKQTDVEEILRRAEEVERADPAYAAEVAPWVRAEGPEGVPASSIPEINPHRPAMPSRYHEGAMADPQVEKVEFVEGLLALATVDDDQVSWLRCGETLSALWLAAVRHGLSLLPLSQPTEVPETRERLRRDVLEGLGRPQLLVRLGWQEITRGELPRTPRRPVEEVLRFD
ncbi:Acg family FMN-binding oxidoreductase [Nocardioides sp. MAHUQ-72]|uniref:Acg family FMN-binding oxidoreductase n=1 Tax=unclassified Nocardioides TaxID=2615069 RepID=UPI00361C9C28